MTSTMTRAELEQVKADVENGVMISRETWKRVLRSAIGAQTMAFNMQQDALYPGYQVPVASENVMHQYKDNLARSVKFLGEVCTSALEGRLEP